MKPAYYNEIDKYAAQWLRNLIAAGLIAPGDVDERSIVDVRPNDLRPYAQCHFFAGIGVWSRALRQAGVSDNTNVWTGSCPCQPFSAAGKAKGFDDERHLWPYWQYLIEECRPSAVLGEQVASKGAEPWIDLVQDDLEGLGYAVGAVPFPAAGVGAPHIRDRLYWVAYAGRSGLEKRIGVAGVPGGEVRRESRETIVGTGICLPSGLADAECDRSYREGGDAAEPGIDGQVDRLPIGSGEGLWLPDPGPTNGFWRDADWLGCRDGKWRPVEPGTFPLANGAAARVGRLRAYGNAINAEQATVFIQAAIEAGAWAFDSEL